MIRRGVTGRVVVLAAGLALLAGCGRASTRPEVATLATTTATSGSETSASAGPGSSPGGAALAFAACMRSHGEPGFPDPLPSGGYSRTTMNAVDPKSPRFRSAETACSSLAIAAGVEHTPAQKQHHLEVLIAVAECMRAHGVPDFPDPNSQGVVIGGSSLNSPRERAAEKICNRLNPGTG